MNILWPMIAILALTGPAFAAEVPVATADPELAALEQEILDTSLLSIGDVDLNYNDRCDPEEKALLLTAGGFFFDRDGDGKTDLVELATRILKTADEYDFNTSPFLKDYRTQHPGQLRVSELRRAIEQQEALIFIARLAGVSMKEKGWQQPLLAQLIKEEDLNRNGILDHDELVMRGAKDRVLGFMLGNNQYQHDGAGIVSQTERTEGWEAIKADMDLDNDGNVSLYELKVLALLLPELFNPEDPLFSSQSAKEMCAAYTKRFLPRYDRNGDGRWQPLEMKFAKQTENELTWFFVKITQNNPPSTPAARDALIQRLLADRDLNGNGKIDYAEIPRNSPYDMNYPDFGMDRLDRLIGQRLSKASPPIPPEVWKSLFQPPSLKRISQNPRVPATTLADCMKTLLSLYDSNRDGKLDAEEMLAGAVLESFLNPRYYWKAPIPVPLEQQQAWIAKLLPRYDDNHDGRLSAAEAFHLAKAERIWQYCFHYSEAEAKLLDKDGDGWLNPEERQPLLQKILKLHDFNKNGILDQQEESAFYQENLGKLSIFRRALTLAEEDEWNRHRDLFDFNQDGRVEIERIYPSVFFEASKDDHLSFPDLLRWHEFMLKNYDHNQNGRVDQEEFQEYSDWAAEWETSARSWGLPRKPSSLPELQKWALANGDANHDGKLSLQELADLNKYEDKRREVDVKGNKDLFELLKIDTRQPTLAELATVKRFRQLIFTLSPLYPEFDKNKDDWLDENERLPVAKLLLKTGDLNGNGRLDFAEVYQLMRQYGTKANEARDAKTRRQEDQAKRRQDAEWLKKYDFNGNGKLDPEERTRAEADSKAGIQAPARDE